MNKASDYKIGLISVIFCQFWWGFCPIFWEALKPMDSKIIILYRLFTMFVFSLIAARFKYSWKEIFGPLRDKKVRRKYFIAGLFLATNWSIYVWAMVTERVIQSTIGYYIEPLVICMFGVVIFKEKLTKFNIIATGFACVAVLIILVHFGQLPATGLGLAFTWATYSAIKKTSEQPAIISLVYETMIFGIAALFIIIYIESRGMGGLSYHMPVKYGLLFLTGLVTVIPVGLFSVSATKIPLFMIGLIQYISPTITFILGVFLFKEPIDQTLITAFLIVWVGLVIYTYGQIKDERREHNEITGQ